MKKACSILALVLTLASVQAQEVYRSVFVDGLTEWNYIYFEGLNEPSNIGATIYSMNTNTRIWDGQSYHLCEIFVNYNTIYVYDSIDYSMRLPLGTNYWMRESEDHSQLYRILEENAPEELVMDLNWGVGDTISLWDSWLGQTQSPVVIDSIYFKDGRKHLRTTHYLTFLPRMDFNNSYFYDTLVFIEGIGPSIGTMPFEHGDRWVPLLTCYYENLDIAYFLRPNDPRITLCTAYPPGRVNHAEQSIGKIRIAPNPTYGDFRIDGLSPGRHRAEIWNLTGQLLGKYLIDASHATVSFPLNEGVYILRVAGYKEALFQVIKR